MTPEDAINLLEQVAQSYNRNEAASFRERALEDLFIFRQSSHAEFQTDKERPQHRKQFRRPIKPFTIPSRYTDVSEFFVVFSSFFMSFIDPISCTVHALSLFQELHRQEKIEHIAFDSGFESQDFPDELELVDISRLKRDLEEMNDAASQIGRHLLGEQFKFEDFVDIGDIDER